MSGIMQLHQLQQMERMRGQEPFQEPIPFGGRTGNLSREQLGWGVGGLATGLAPGAGLADAFGYLPDPFAVGEYYPSMAENIRQGQWADVGMQALGLGADALSVLGLAGVAAGTMVRGARTANRADPAIVAARETPVLPPNPAEPLFELPPDPYAYYEAKNTFLRAPLDRISVGERGLFNDLGLPVATNLEDMQNFSDWFGRSVARQDNRPVVLYHGTLDSFDTFAVGDVGFHVGTREQANTRVLEKTQNTGRLGQVLPVYAKAERPLIMRDVGKWNSPKTVYKELPADLRRQLGAGFYDDLVDNHLSPAEAFDEIRDVLRRAGYDSIAYENRYEGPGHSLILLNPTQLKSATGNVGRFDPTAAAVTAGVGAGAVGLGMMRREPAEEDLESLRAALQGRGL